MVSSNIKNKRLVFTVTPGRSGTKYLSILLKYLPNVTCFHEPDPNFSEVMRYSQTNKKIAYDFWIEKKLPFIEQCNTFTYIETSHMFCKGFLQPLLDLNIIPDLIILKRSCREVAKSLFKLKVIPGRTKKGLIYLLSPEDPGVLYLPNWNNFHDYQLCLWYCLEIERRQKIYGELLKAKNARVVLISIEDLSKISKFLYLLRELDLYYLNFLVWLYYLRNRSKKVNQKVDEKTFQSHGIKINSLEDDLFSCINFNIIT